MKKNRKILKPFQAAIVSLPCVYLLACGQSGPLYLPTCSKQGEPVTRITHSPSMKQPTNNVKNKIAISEHEDTLH